MAEYAKSIDEKSAELLQAYNDAETEDEKRKAKVAYIRFYRKLVKSKEFVSLSATIAEVPEYWREEIQRRVDERIAADRAAEEQDIPAEEALDIILGSESV